MRREDIVNRIRARADDVLSLGATALYIYGSRARGDERPDSDLDVYIDFDPARLTFVELVALEDMLSADLGLSVQLSTHDSLHPLIRMRVEREALRVI